MKSTNEFVKITKIRITKNMNSETRRCQNCKKEFVIEPEDFEFYQKIKVPSPTWCPECRLVRKFSFRNERNLYKRKCSLCNKDIIAAYPNKTQFPVYCSSCWHSDRWDPLQYGRDFDYSKPFFEQFKKLIERIPRLALISYASVNSEYTNFAGRNKNCYLIISSGYCEDCLYGYRLDHSRDCVDCESVNKSELCYDCFQCVNCYQCIFSKDCENCNNVILSYNCRNCSFCFGCVNLRNKSYFWFNQPLTKEKYFKKLALVLGSFSEFSANRQSFQNSLYKFIFKFARLLKTFNCIGENITHSENCKYCFDVHESQNLKYTLFGVKLFDSYDCSHVDYSELNYESYSGDKDSRKFFTYICWLSQDLFYCDTCVSSHNLFGCISLEHKSYCILNNQYTKEEYEKLVPKIIEHMNKMPYIDKKGRVYKYGEFFPPELSPFCYNETIAQEYFPLTKEEALKQGYSWKDFPEREEIKPDIDWKELPDHIKDVKDDIIGKIIFCKSWDEDKEKAKQYNCTKGFKIIEPELEFYRKMNLPLPRYCPNCRHFQRIKQRNPLKLWHRKCSCGGLSSANGVYKNTIKHFHSDNPCPNTFETTYAPDRPEIVYCEQCYLAEVV